MLRSLALAGVVAISGTAAAYASTLSGTVTGSFSAPTGQTGSTLVQDGAGTDTLSWGAPSGRATTVEKGNAAALSVNPSTFSHANARSGEYLLGSVSWVNHSNWYTGGTWDSVMSLDMSFDTATGTLVHSIPVTFTMVNTQDTSFSTDENERTGSNPDVVRGFDLNGALSAPLKLGGGLSLTQLRFRLDDADTPGTAWTSSTGFTHNGVASGSQYDPTTGLWESREGGTSTIGIYGSLTAVPLPAGMILMLSGIASFFVLRRRLPRHRGKSLLDHDRKSLPAFQSLRRGASLPSF